MIAIIAILAALIFPALSKARAQAKQTACISNLKQIGAALTMYMTDHDDIFPHAVDAVDKFKPEIWAQFPEFQARIPNMPFLYEALDPYTKGRGVWHCAADSGTRVVDNHPWLDFTTSPTMHRVYGSSYFFRTEIAFKFFSSTQFQLPADVNVLFDAAGHWHGSTGRLELGDSGETVLNKIRGYRYNVLYGDLHAKSRNYDQLQMAWAQEL